MTSNQIVQSVTRHCIANVKLADVMEGYYASMPLCVVDSVFSIGVRYEGVKNTINRLADFYGFQLQARKKFKIPALKEQVSTTKFLQNFKDMSPSQLAEEIFVNRQRTSVKNGILKTEAVVKFLEVLKDFNANYYQDIPRLIDNKSFELCIKSIPGQGSGISLKYFFMLTGTEDLIKPDRMIVRFLQDATGQKFNHEECQMILSKVVEKLNVLGYDLTPRRIDNAIWTYQRALNKA